MWPKWRRALAKQATQCYPSFPLRATSAQTPPHGQCRRRLLISQRITHCCYLRAVFLHTSCTLLTLQVLALELPSLKALKGTSKQTQNRTANDNGAEIHPCWAPLVTVNASAISRLHLQPSFPCRVNKCCL